MLLSRRLLLIPAVGICLFLLSGAVPVGGSDTSTADFAITGRLVDSLGWPVEGAIIAAHSQATEIASRETPPEGELKTEPSPLAENESQEDGSWELILPDLPVASVTVTIERPHFQPQAIHLEADQLELMVRSGSYNVGELTMERRISAGFWAATIVFVGMLLLIATERLHSATAALAGLSAILLVSAVGSAFFPDLYIFSFEQGLEYINWEVIFLVMAMMIIIAIIERTGIFQWTAFQTYRMSGGRSWLLVLVLMAVTAVASALLDNFTTMLLMTPISLQIALAMGINPLALIIPEVMASNVGGISTLIGTPTNILIGAYADISFTDFLVNQTVGVLLALVLMAGYVLFHYRSEWRKSSGGISSRLYKTLEKNARIENPDQLLKSGIVFVLVLVGFVLGERIDLVPTVPALIGATILLIWLKPDIHETISAVDWTTLVFFMALFIVVGAVQEVGLISSVALGMSLLIGESLVLAILVVVLGVGTLSTVVTNIPLTASMLPVVEFLSGSIPGASNKVLYYALSMGAAMGGNGLLISAEANLVTAGITEQAGSPISFNKFLKIGLPVTYLTLAVGSLWLLLWFVILGN